MSDKKLYMHDEDGEMTEFKDRLTIVLTENKKMLDINNEIYHMTQLQGYTIDKVEPFLDGKWLFHLSKSLDMGVMFR